MQHIRKKLLLFSIFILSSALIFIGCTKNVYENMTLQLNETMHEITLSDDQSENVFNVVATVNNRPNNYDGAVTFTISNPTNSIELVEVSGTNNGRTTATYTAKNPGISVITVITKQGNKRGVVTVKVVKPLEDLTFTTTDILPLARAEQINLTNFLNFKPFDTNQKQVAFTVSPKAGSGVSQEALNLIQINGNMLFIPQNANVTEFVLTATSLDNPEIYTSVEVVVVNMVTFSEINVMYDNNTPNNADDDIALSKLGEDYVLELARNTLDLSSKMIYFNFASLPIYQTEYIVDYDIYSSSIAQLDKVISKNNTFEFKAIGEGSQTFSFLIRHAQYPNYTSLHKRVTIKVNVVSYPSKIEIVNPTTKQPITTLDVFDNYTGQNRYGTPIQILVSDQNGLMPGQQVNLFTNVANYDKILIRDQFGIKYNANDKITTGSILYVSHTLEDGDQVPPELKLVARSVTYNNTQLELDLNFIRGEVNIGVTDPVVKINKSQNSGPGYEYGFKQIEFTGINEAFDRRTLTFAVADPTIVTVEALEATVMFVGTGKVGQTTVTVTSPNGSSVVITVIVFEELSKETTKLIVPGKSPISALDNPDAVTVADLRNDYTYTFKNGLAIDLSFILNGVQVTSIPGGINAFTTAFDLNGNFVTSDIFIVRANTYKQITTQNIRGESLVTVTLRGYNALGDQTQVLVYKFIVKVEVPITTLTTNSSEVTLYDYNSLSPNQANTYGVHTINLTTNPVNASFTLNDISWHLVYENNLYSAQGVEQGNFVYYTFVLGNSSSYVLLETNKLNIRTARVSVYRTEIAPSSETFAIMAVINQKFFNEFGQTINSRQEARVKFTANRAIKVQDIIFNNVTNQTVTFDARDLNYSGGSFNAPIEQRTKVVDFTVLPYNALTQNLAVEYPGTDISVSVDNINKKIYIVAQNRSSTGAPIVVKVYPVDSVTSGNIYTKSVDLIVEILDGSTENLAYKIANENDLRKISQFMNAYYVLTNNITITSSNWIPLGAEYINGEPVVTEFTGQLNGGYTIAGKTYYYTISGLRFSNSNTEFKYNHIGLFAVIGSQGRVKNITINNFYLDIQDNTANNKEIIFAGAIAGLNKGLIENSTVNDGNAVMQNTFINRINNLNDPNSSENINNFTYGIRLRTTASESRLIAIGGLVGVNQNILRNNRVESILINYNDTSISQVFAGGMVGLNEGQNAVITKEISENYNSQSNVFDVVSAINIDESLSLSNTNSSTGGAVGFNTGEISNYVVRTFIINALSNVGGIAGKNSGNIATNSTIKNNLSVPTIRGIRNVGGLVGYNQDASFSLQQEENRPNFFTGFITNINQINAAQVVNNRVEFIDYKYNISLFNTAIVALNNAGGLIGYNYSYVGYTNPVFIFTNGIAYNSVFSYYTSRNIVDYYTTSQLNAKNNAYFGDILLRNVHNESFEEQNYVGGLIGYSTNAFIANSQVNVNIQANGAILGGLIGIANGSQANNGVLFVLNTAVSGKFINRSHALQGGTTSISANFVGDASGLIEIIDGDNVRAENYEPNIQLQGKEFSNVVITRSYSVAVNENNESLVGFAGIGLSRVDTVNSVYLNQNLTLTLAWQNREMPNGDLVYHYATLPIVATMNVLQNGITETFNYTINQNGNEYTGTATFATTSLFTNVANYTNFSSIVIEANELELNDVSGIFAFSESALVDGNLLQNNPNYIYSTTSLYYSRLASAGYSIYQLLNDSNSNGIDNVEDLLISNYISLDPNVLVTLNLTQQQIESKVEALKSKVKEFYGVLNTKYWYLHANLNNGLPVILAPNKYFFTHSISNNLINFDTQISLLANWSPTDINATAKPNHSNVWQADNQTRAVIFYNQLSSSAKLPNGQYNFGNNANLSQELINNLTLSLLSQLTQANTYSIDDVFNLETVPSFIGKGAVQVVSSNPAILSVENANGKLSLVAKGTGKVTLTITSNYNSALNKVVTVYIVHNVMEYNQLGTTGTKMYKTQNGVREVLKQVDKFDIYKTNETYIRSLVLETVQNNVFTFSNSNIGTVNFETLANGASGTRYYLLDTVSVLEGENSVTYNTLFHSNPVVSTPIKINNTNYTNVEVNGVAGKYYAYVDVPYNSNAVITSDEISQNTILAVPYITTQDGYKVVMFNESELINRNGRVSQVNENELLSGLEYANQFTVETKNGTWGLTASSQSVSFDPMSITNFAITINTDNADELLYLTYVDAQNVVRSIRVNNLNTSLNHNAFSIGNIDFNVSYNFASNKKTYYFELSVSDENKINSAYETIKEVFSRQLTFFTLYDSASVEYDSGFITTNLTGLIEYSRNVTVTLTPQLVKNISMAHYPNGELRIINDGGPNDGKAEMNLQEVAYNNIIPGYSGILKINVVPFFTNYEYITITSSGAGTSVVNFEQMIASYEGSNFRYIGIYPFEEQIPGGISLRKESFRNYENGNFVHYYDGNLYVRTLINSFLGENNTFTITLTGYGYENGQLKVVFTDSINLNVITPPGLNMSYNGQKFAPIAIGTSVDINVELTGVTGDVNFADESYVVNQNNETVGGFGSYFTLVKVSNNIYRLTTSLGIPQGYSIVLVGKVSKQINGETYRYRDTIKLLATNFVINGISVNGVVNGSYLGVFNQIYDLSVKIDATYDSRLSGVEQEIRNLERYWSTIKEAKAENNNVWFYLNPNTNTEVLIKHKGYNASRSYIISTGVLSGDYAGVTGFKLQNTIYNSGDVLGARVSFEYTTDGIKYEGLNKNSGLYVEKSTTFNFAFYRVSNEDNPEPIRTAQEFMQMRSGVDYILLNDITLSNWIPLSTNIGSLDGNGFVITINSFNNNLSYTSTGDVNVGLFTTIPNGTTIKNLTIEIKPSQFVDILEENANTPYTNPGDLDISYETTSTTYFGILAGRNEGIVTNVNVTYDASALKLERDLILLNNDSDNPDFEKYWTNAFGVQLESPNYDLFLQDNISKYFPRKNIQVNDRADLWNESTNSIHYIKITDSTALRRDLSVLKLRVSGTAPNVGGLVGYNSGYITNSSVENVSIVSTGNLAGLVAVNSGKISSSHFKGANLVNQSGISLNTNTAGLVVTNLGTIQYSYVMGREGLDDSFPIFQEKATYETQVGTIKTTPSSYSNKTGLTQNAKANYAGYGYSIHHNLKVLVGNEYKDYDYNITYGALRAMNSAVLSAGEVGGFVHNNTGTILNSYSNILLNSSTGTAGFVFRNQTSGIIRDVYTLSSVQTNSENHSPFTGKDNLLQYLNSGLIEYAYFLTSNSVSDSKPTDITYEDKFIVGSGEHATSLSFSEFSDYNAFQGFAFNSDYSENKELDRSVWFIPNGYEHVTENNSLNNFKHKNYLLGRPELVATNLKTLSIRVLISGEGSVTNSYRYVGNIIGSTILNPDLIRSAEEFNEFVTTRTLTKTESGEVVVENHNYIRFVSDISFNIFDVKARTYNIDYYGDLDGNGMTINQLRLVSDSSFENIDAVKKLGLFGSINSNENKRGIVRNLNIVVSEVRGTNANFVGVLAGRIDNASVYNVKISGSETIQGKHVVGGLAGYIGGDSEIVNIEVNGVGAKSSYYKFVNPFSAQNYRVSNSNIGTFELFNITTNGEEEIANLSSISYVGGIAGILNVNPINENEDSTLRSARARRLTVTGGFNLVGEVVGGIFGGVGKDSTANDLTLVVTGSPKIIASRAAGGLVGDLRGTIDRGSVRHATSVQTAIDNELKNYVYSNNYQLNRFVNSSQNYNTLFGGNPNYMGGLVGINYDGNIQNSYNKINVLNLNSTYAGGITGYNIGGTYSSVYTTASVLSFRVIGGIIGVQVQSEFLEINGAIRDTVANLITDDIRYIDYTNSQLNNATRTTVLSGISAINLWRASDVNIDARYTEYFNSSKTVIGAMVGKVILSSTRPGNQGINRYFLSDAIKVDGGLSTTSRSYNDSNYFNQVYLNNYYGTNGKLSGDASARFDKLMPEIGAINNTTEILTTVNQSSIMQRQLGELDLRIVNDQISYVGRSGDITVGSGENITTFHYSRLQNLGSARTIKEFIERIYVREEAVYMGEVAPTSNPTNKLPRIYYNWAQNVWKGTRLTQSGLLDSQYVFPHLSPVADPLELEVRTAEDLTLLGTFTRTHFILMNDIDVSEYVEWTPYGTFEKPFRGRISSNGNANYTISNLNISTDINPYIGLVGYTTKSQFRNFNIHVRGLNISNPSTTSEVYVGALFGYGDDVVVENITVDSSYVSGGNIAPFTLASYSVAAMGGIGGAAFNASVNNATVRNADITLRSAVGINGVLGTYAGGAFGVLSLGDRTLNYENVLVQDVNVLVLPQSGSTHLIGDNYYGYTISVGGAFGKLTATQVHTNLANVVVENTKNDDLEEGDMPNVNLISLRVESSNLINVSEILGEIAIGGVAGIASNVTLNNENTYTNSTVNYVRLLLNIINNNVSVYAGGVFGSYVGGIDHVENTPNLSYLNVSNVVLKVTHNGRHFDELESISHSIYVGGFAGSVASSIIDHIEVANVEIDNLIDNMSVNFDADKLNIGGFAGSANLIKFMRHVLADAKIDVYSNAKTLNAGGLVGILKGSENNITFEKLASSGILTLSSYKNSAVTNAGGLVGAINNAKLTESISNGMMSFTQSNNTTIATTRVGGMVGFVDTYLQDSLTTSLVQISNSYSTKDISVQLNGNSQNNVLHYGGLVGYADVDYLNDSSNGYDKAAFIITNSYSITKPVIKNTGKVVEYNTTNESVYVGGAVGEIKQTSGYNESNTPNVLISGVFYSGETLVNSNNIGTALSINRMLLNNMLSFTEFNTSGPNAQWVITNNKFPLLTYFNDSALSNFAKSYQAVGTIQNPEIYNSANGISEYKSYIVNSELSITNNDYSTLSLINTNLFFTPTAPTIKVLGVNEYNFAFYVISPYSLLYNARFENNSLLIANTNHGYIVGVTGGNNSSVYYNQGYIIGSEIISMEYNLGYVAMTSFNGMGVEYSTININSGIVEKSVVRVLFNNGISKNNYYLNSYTLNLTNHNSESFTIADARVGNIATLLSKFDFENTWVAINTTGQVNERTLNYGLPILRWKLKTHWLDSEINNEHLWIGEFNYSSGLISQFGNVEFGGSGITYTGMLNYINSNSTILVNTPQDLAVIAYMASVGNTISEEKQISFGSGNTYTTTQGLNGSIVNRIVSETYKYGVKTTTTKYYVDFAGKEIVIASNIDLAGKLWTPIGFGLDNSYYKEYLGIENQNFNAFRGKIKGVTYGTNNNNAPGGVIIKNISVVENNRNAGLFGTVVTSQNGTAAESSFANNIVMKDGFVYAGDSNQEGFVGAGALVGKLLYNINTIPSGLVQNYIISGFGNQNVAVVSKDFVGGIAGVIARNSFNTSANKYAVIYKSYVTGYNESINLKTNGFASQYLGAGISEVFIALREVYFAGTLAGINVSSAFISNNFEYLDDKFRVLLNANDLLDDTADPAETSAYSTVSTSDFSVKFINAYDLRHYNLANFNFGPDINYSWHRISDVNQGYPLFAYSNAYWISTVSTVTPSGSTYTVNNAQELAWIAVRVNNGLDDFAGKTIILGNNINLEEKLWTSIGTAINPFKGTFNGNNYEIRNLVTFGIYTFSDGLYMNTGNNNVGLFGTVENATIRNVVLKQHTDIGGGGPTVNETAKIYSVNGTNNVGALVGFASNSTIENIEANGQISGANNVGGVIGYALNSTITNITSNATVNGTTNVGGIIGLAEENAEELTKLKNTGNVTGINNVGGVVGRLYETDLNGVHNGGNDNTGKITGRVNVGGIVGDADNVTISAVTNKGEMSINNITSSQNIGGVVGKLNGNLYEAKADTGSTIKPTNSSSISNVGGVVGYRLSGIIANVLSEKGYDDNLIGATNAGDIVGFYNQVASEYNVNYINMAVTNKYAEAGSRNLIGNSSSEIDTVKRAWSTLNGPQPENYFSGISHAYSNDSFNEQDLFTYSSVMGITSNAIQIKYTLNYSSFATDDLVGEGTIASPYIINNSTIARINKEISKRYIVNNSYKYYRVDNDFTTTSAIASQAYPLIGEIDGNNKTITIENASVYASTGGRGVGFIRNITGTNTIWAVIKNLTLTPKLYEINLDFEYYVGVLVGKATRLSMSNVQVYPHNSGGNINLIAGANVGGVVGWLNSGTLTNVNTSTPASRFIITVKAQNGGGMIGFAQGSVSIIASSVNYTKNYNIVLANSSSVDNIGGIVGRATSGNITLNYVRNLATDGANNAVYGRTNIGGIIGYGENIQITNTENNGKVSGYSNVGGIVGQVRNNGYYSITAKNYGEIVSDFENSTSYSGVGGIVGRAEDISPSSEILVHIISSENNGIITSKYNNVGGIIGYGNKVRVANSSSLAVVKGAEFTNLLDLIANENIGGIAGYVVDSELENNNFGSTINNDKFVIGNKGVFLGITVVVSGNNVGGVAGFASNTSITNNTIHNEVMGRGSVGGVVGNFESITQINSISSNTITSALITGTNYVGGVIGYSSTSAEKVILYNNTINNATIKGTSYVGGLAGRINRADISSNTFSNVVVAPSNKITIDSWIDGMTFGDLGLEDKWTPYNPFTFVKGVEPDNLYVGGTMPVLSSINIGKIAGNATDIYFDLNSITGVIINNIEYYRYHIYVEKIGDIGFWDLHYVVTQYINIEPNIRYGGTNNAISFASYSTITGGTVDEENHVGTDAHTHFISKQVIKHLSPGTYVV